jgi:hypothetical protein
MASNSLKRNIFTEKLFEAIEEPWSNESTPSCTPAKNVHKVRDTDAALLTSHAQESLGLNNDAMHLMLKSAADSLDSLDDEPDFIVWKLAEKMFLRRMRIIEATAFTSWISEICRAAKSKRMSHKSRILHRRKVQLKMFNNWYGTVILISKFGKRKLDLANFVKSKTKKCIVAYFGHFKRATLSIHAKSAINRRCCIRLLRSCIDKWQKLSAARARNYTKSLKMAYKLCLRASLRAWVCLVKSNRRLESILRIYQRRMIRKNVNTCFKRWYHCKMTSCLMPSKSAWLAHHLDELKQKHSVAVIKAWSRISAHRRQARSVFLKTLCRKMLTGQLTYDSWCLQSAIIHWREKTRKTNVPTSLNLGKKTRSAKHVPISTIFICWSRYCVVDQRTKYMALRHFRLKSVIALKKSFQIWKTVAKTFHTAKIKSNNLFKYRNINRKIKALMVWRHVLAAASTGSAIRADSFRLQSQKRKQLLLWNRWKQRALNRLRLARAYKSRARLRLSTIFSLRSLFWDWKMGILSEQFFANYIMKRFLGLWRQLLKTFLPGSQSACSSPLESNNPNPTMAIKTLDLDLTCGTRPCSMAQIYRRKVLRFAVHGWAWTCSQRSALLEKLQIAYMIRSSIRTCTRYFSAWSNETLKISQTSMCKKPITPSLEKQEHEPLDATQRAFEILNIALVDRILLCNTSKKLVRKSFRSWLHFSRTSSTIQKTSILRVLSCSFSKWVEVVLSHIAECSMKRIAPIFKSWKWLSCRNSTFKDIVAKIEDRRFVLRKNRAMNAWCMFTYGKTMTRGKKSHEGCNVDQVAWKNFYFSFRTWHIWTKTSMKRFRDLEATATCKFIAGMSQIHFNAWKFISKSSRESKELMNTNRLRSIRQVFQGWSRCAFVKRKADKLIVTLQNYQATAMLVLCWNAWRGGLEQRNYRTLTLSVTAKLIQKCNAVSVPVRIAWNAWRNFISTRRFVRSAKEKLARQVCEKVNFRNMFRRWRIASRRRRNISVALAKPCTVSLRQAFFALKYNIVRSVFFARQYKRLSLKFHRKHRDSQGQDFLKPLPQTFSQASPKSDSQPEITILEEKVVELQSEKIELMEQLKSALQGRQNGVHSPTLDQDSEQEIPKNQMADSNDRKKTSKLVPNNHHDVSSCQHPLFPVQQRGQHFQKSSTAGKAPTPTNAPYQQHPLFPVLPQNEHQSQGGGHHQETKVFDVLSNFLLHTIP